MWYIRVSIDNGKSFEMVEKTIRRDYAFQAFVRVSEDARVKLYHDNKLVTATHLEDAKAELAAMAAKS